MNFDTISMKRRARTLMKETHPKPLLIGLIFEIFVILYVIAFFVSFTLEKDLYIILSFGLLETIFINIRNSFRFYSIKVTREEKTKVSDVFSAYKEKPVKVLLLGIVRNLLHLIGFCIIGVGFFIPFYVFRMSCYVIKDENVNIFQALSRSKKLMFKHYAELIKLDLSNIGWFLLMIITFGAAGFYVIPYTSIVYAEFYDYLKAQEEFMN